jgi:hypothetical protein
VLASFESKPVIGMRLANAHIVSFQPGTLTLAVADRGEVEKVEKSRKEIEEAVAGALGETTKVVFVVAGANAPVLVKSEVGAESDALAADRRSREAEARQHPIIRQTQDLFGAPLKEVKVP